MKVIVTDQAIAQLEESLEFYKDELHIPLEKVNDIKTSLLLRAKSLEKNPFLGQLEPYLHTFKTGHRRIIEGHFKIVYRVENGTVYITDFFDSRKNPSKMKG